MKKADKTPKDDSLTPERAEFLKKSLEFFKNPGLLELIRVELDKDHIDDNREKLFILCSELSSQLQPQYRFSTALTGYTSEGKTNIWKVTSRHIPIAWYLDLTRATKAVLEDDIKDVNLIYFGEEGANKDIVETIKQLVEDGIRTRKKDVRDNFKTVRIEEQPRKVGIYSTTKDASDQELATRYAVVCITGSQRKYKKVNDDTKLVASDVDLEIARSIRDTGKTWISAGLEQLQSYDIITVPYAYLLTVDNRKARSMRDLKRFFNLIRVLAWLHQHQRITYECKGRSVLVTSPADFWNAMEIGSNIFAQSLSGIEQRQQNVIDSYRKLIKDNKNIHCFDKDGKPDPRVDNELIWIDRSLIQDDLHIGARDTIRSHIKSLESSGFFSSFWNGGRNFVAMKHKSPTNSPTNYPLITDEQSKVYHDIETKYDEILVGKTSAGSRSSPPVDSSLLNFSKILSEKTPTKKRPTNDKKNKQTKKKVRLKPPISRSKLVGDYTATDMKRYCKANYDEKKTISYAQLKKEFPDQFITGLIECQYLKIQPNGNYRFVEAIDNEETD